MMSSAAQSTPAPGRFLSIKEVRAQTSLHTATIYRRMDAGKFPRAHPIGGGRVVWLESEIEDWKRQILQCPPND
jgi:prophage regulatory protein